MKKLKPDLQIYIKKPLIESLEPQLITLEVWIFDANRIREIDPSDWEIEYLIEDYYAQVIVESGTLSLVNVDPWFAKTTLNVPGDKRYEVIIIVYYHGASQGTWRVYNFAP